MDILVNDCEITLTQMQNTLSEINRKLLKDDMTVGVIKGLRSRHSFTFTGEQGTGKQYNLMSFMNHLISEKN